MRLPHTEVTGDNTFKLLLHTRSSFSHKRNIEERECLSFVFVVVKGGDVATQDPHANGIAKGDDPSPAQHQAVLNTWASRTERSLACSYQTSKSASNAHLHPGCKGFCR